MKKEIKRNYLQINSLKELVETPIPSNGYFVNFLNPPNFQLNKFFYKNIGKDHQWSIGWFGVKKNGSIMYPVKKSKLYIKKNEDVCGYFELIFHADKKEFEIAYFGLLKEYHNKKLGSFYYPL